MYKCRHWLPLCLMLLVVTGCSALQPEPATPSTQPAPPSAKPGIWAALPDLVSDGDMAVAKQAILGAKGQDLQGKDFSHVSLERMYDLTYDTGTRWPDAKKLPAGYDPGRALSWGIDPGLGLRALHGQGIDGRGVAVAVFDKPIRQTHQEFAERIHYLEVFPNDPKNGTFHFHGAATASILAGQSIGVAPGATLYYFAVPDNGENLSNYEVAMEQLLARNAVLPPVERIRVISISDGYNEQITGREEIARWEKMIRTAESQGIAVIHCSVAFAVPYDLTGAIPEKDRNNPDNYPGTGYRLLVPGYARTTADNESDTAYAYWAKGGASWVAPYLAGLAALGLQVNPNATPQQMYSLMLDTATMNQKGLRILNPAGFVQRLK
ncbi:MAG TPA: S8 family serine peptidase [Symbiobacteriaceae bacterium]|nr:S8 family serine peptidase [Symbiobacteriaceae bacterium]